MQNLKITIHLKNAAKLDRLTTIDSILLSKYYAFMEKKGKRLDFDKEHKTVNFIHRENGVFSGSIWYLNEDADIFLDFETKVKMIEERKIFDNTFGNKKVTKMPDIKNAIIKDEVIFASSIYFYIKGDMKTINLILQTQLNHVGKDRKLGYGEVELITVEEINKDKGFMLDKNTASKPLPISDFKVNSKKVAFFRRVAPYWLDDDLEPCYMPTMMLQEAKDTSNDKDYIYSEIDYIHNVNFIYDCVHNKSCELDEAIKFENTYENGYLKGVAKKFNIDKLTDNSKYKCAFSGMISKNGLKCDLDAYFNGWKRGFGDFNYFKNNSFLSQEAYWCIENIANLGYSFVSKDEFYYMQGSKKQDGKTLNDFIPKFNTLKPPFSINLKDTANAQHISFKGKVSISNAFFFIQYGNSRIYVDTQILNEAREELATLLEANKDLKKAHFLGNFLDSYHVVLSKKTLKHQELILNFQRKYNSDTRKLLSIVAF